MFVKDALGQVHTSNHKYQILILPSLYDTDSYQMVLVKNRDIWSRFSGKKHFHEVALLGSSAVQSYEMAIGPSFLRNEVLLLKRC